MGRRAFHVQILQVHGVEFKSNVKVHAGLVGVGSEDGSVTQEQKHGASAVHDAQTQSLAWKNERFTFDIAAALANRARDATIGTAVPSLRVQLVAGMVGFAKVS